MFLTQFAGHHVINNVPCKVYNIAYDGYNIGAEYAIRTNGVPVRLIVTLGLSQSSDLFFIYTQDFQTFEPNVIFPDGDMELPAYCRHVSER